MQMSGKQRSANLENNRVYMEKEAKLQLMVTLFRKDCLVGSGSGSGLYSGGLTLEHSTEVDGRKCSHFLANYN